MNITPIRRAARRLRCLTVFVVVLFWNLQSDCCRADVSPPGVNAVAVAVLDFSVPAAESNRWGWAEGGMADLLQIELQQHGLVLLDRDLIHAVLTEQRMAASGTTSQDYLALTKLLNARHLVAGKVVPLADGRFRVEASVFSVEAVETVVTGTSEGDFPKEMSRVLQRVAKQIAGKLQSSPAPATNTERTAAGPKPEALMMFYRGLNACAHGQPDRGAVCFMNAASLDPDFSAPLLWEIKAYEMGGFTQLSALRRQETADALKRLGVEMAGQTNAPGQPSRRVLAVLNPVVAPETGMEAASLGTTLTRALLASGKVRVFTFEGLGVAVAEQDLQLSSFFARQNAPRYGRWLVSDGLVLARVNPAGSGRVSLELTLVNPLNASVMAGVQRTNSAAKIAGQIQGAVKELLAAWTNRLAVADAPGIGVESASPATADANGDLRPIFRDLVTALALVRREPDKSDSHRTLANALAATGRTRLAAHEIEKCLELLDIHAPRADTTFLGTHRWLFREPSPASGAVGLVDPRAIEHLIEQLLTTYPKTLAAGCLRYNLAVSAWQAQKWPEAILQAKKSREIMQSIIAGYDRNDAVNAGNLDCELTSATYFLEGASLDKLGKRDEAKSVCYQGLEFMETFKVRDVCLPLGPFLGDFFGPLRVYGYGGDPPGIRTRLKQELVNMGESFAAPATSEPPPVTVADTNAPGFDWLRKGQIEFQKENFPAALDCYKKAVAAGAATNTCPGLATALLEIALDRNVQNPKAEFESIRRESGFTSVTVSWGDCFTAGQKYRKSRNFDLDKAVASYRGALNFLENPEQGSSTSRAMTMTDAELLRSENQSANWYTTAYHLAQCLIGLGQKEAAAQWLRRIAIKAGGDGIDLLGATPNGEGWQTVPLGIWAANQLDQLHRETEVPKFGDGDGPYKRPVFGRKARSFSELPPPPAPKPNILDALTNTLAKAAYKAGDQNPNPQLQAFVRQYGHDAVPALLSLLPRAGELWDEPTLGWLLTQTGGPAEATYVVAACKTHWGLIPAAKTMDLKGTAEVIADEWRSQSESGFVSFFFIFAILDARLQPLYPLVLDHIAERKVNHHSVIFRMDGVVLAEKSDELAAAFRVALSQCLKLKLEQHEHYELSRISQVALRHGVPEAVAASMVAEEASPERLRKQLAPFMELPDGDEAMLAYLRTHRARWDWDSVAGKFKPRTDNPR